MPKTLTAADRLQAIGQKMRRWILESTHHAGSGHPTSSLSAVELMAVLFFRGHFRFDVNNPRHRNNDRLIFSKGHASPLFYALWAAAGALNPEELRHYREFSSELEGHPTSRFEYTEAATGSLGQGLSVGVGMALAAKYLDHLPYRTFVLLGDSEMAEGSQWEAIQIAAHYELGNLIGILDVNRLGQRGPTMTGHDLGAFRRRLQAFGWDVVTLDDGHDPEQIHEAYTRALAADDRPVMIVAKTLKGKGVSEVEDVGGWHGKALDDEQLAKAKEEVGDSDFSGSEPLSLPEGESDARPAVDAAGSQAEPSEHKPRKYKIGDEEATRQAYGEALVRLADRYPRLVALDGEVSNSTGAETFAKAYPDRFFEMYVAEQNMVGAATGLALRGYIPFVSTFAAFLTRAFDQLRMAPHSDANIKLVGSHAGISIGQDGPSQMGLEDIAMLRTIPGSTIVYPCDAVSTIALVDALAQSEGIGYLRTTRGKTPVIYDADEAFPIGGSKVLKQSDADRLTVVAAGITLHEAFKAYEALKEEDIAIRVIDLYSIKPIDAGTLKQAAEQTQAIIVVEDHYEAGGIAEAVRAALAESGTVVRSLAVRKKPRSGSPERLMADHKIDADAIRAAAKSLLAK